MFICKTIKTSTWKVNNNSFPGKLKKGSQNTVMLSKRITEKLASNSSVKFVSHTLSAVLLRKLMNVMKNKVSFGWLTDISSFIILLPSIIIVVCNKFFLRYWLITEHWLLSIVLLCPFRVSWEFLYTNDVRWAGKHIIPNNND